MSYYYVKIILGDHDSLQYSLISCYNLMNHIHCYHLFPHFICPYQCSPSSSTNKITIHFRLICKPHVLGYLHSNDAVLTNFSLTFDIKGYVKAWVKESAYIWARNTQYFLKKWKPQPWRVWKKNNQCERDKQKKKKNDAADKKEKAPNWDNIETREVLYVQDLMFI